MKKLAISGVMTAVGLLVIWALTVPVIDRDVYKNDVSVVGGGYSHADVKYIDYRPVINGEQEFAHVWWETTDGEWRRLEWYNGFTRSSGTVCVLRDSAQPGAQFGVNRWDNEFLYMRRGLAAVKAAYERQSIFDRVWIWRVEKLR